MAYTLEQGSRGLDAETIDAMIKQIAARTYKFKQAVSIVPTSTLDNTFFREDPTVLTGGANASIRGIPFGAAFPTMHPKWEQKTVRNIKFGAEDSLAWETIKGSAIDVQARTIIKLTEGVVSDVDGYIWDQLTQSRLMASSLDIQSSAITLGRFWDVSSAAITDDLARAEELIGDKNYDTGDLMVFVSPKDYRYMKKWVVDKGSQFQGFAESVAQNGKVARLNGMQIVVSPNVTASFALVVKPKTCATFKEFESLKSTTINDPYKSILIRIVEEGVIELTDPKAICLIHGTQSGTA